MRYSLALFASLLGLSASFVPSFHHRRTIKSATSLNERPKFGYSESEKKIDFGFLAKFLDPIDSDPTLTTDQRKQLTGLSALFEDDTDAGEEEAGDSTVDDAGTPPGGEDKSAPENE